MCSNERQQLAFSCFYARSSVSTNFQRRFPLTDKFLSHFCSTPLKARLCVSSFLKRLSGNDCNLDDINFLYCFHKQTVKLVAFPFRSRQRGVETIKKTISEQNGREFYAKILQLISVLYG